MTIIPRAASLAALLALSALPAAAQTSNEYYTIPAQIFPNGEPGRPDVMYMLTSSSLADDLDLTPVASVPDKVKAELSQVVFSGSGAPLLFLLHDVFGGGSQAQAGSIGPGLSSAMFLTRDGALPPRGNADMLEVQFDFDDVAGDYSQQILVSLPVSRGGAKTLAVGTFGTPDTADDVVVGHRQGLTLLYGLPGTPPTMLEMDSVDFTTSGEIVQDVVAADLNGDGRDELLVATGDNAGNGNLRVYSVSTNDTLVPEVSVPGAFASVHALDVDGDSHLEVVAVEHRSTPPNVTADVRLFQDDGSGGIVTTSTVLLSRSSPIGILPRYGEVGDLDGDGFDDLVLTSNDTIVGTASASATPPLFIDRLMNNGDGTFDVFTRFTRFAGRAVDPLVYDPTPIPVPESPLGDFSVATPPIVVTTFASNPGHGATLPQQQVTETFTHAFEVQDGGLIVDTGEEIVHDPAEPLEGVGDGFAGDVDGDGEVDLVMPLRDSDEVYVQYGDDDGLSSTAQRLDAFITPPPVTTEPTGPSDVWGGDLDSNGDDDIVVWSEFGHSGARWTVHRETTGTRSYTAHQEVTAAFSGDMVVGDYDGNGRVDLVATQHRGASAGGPLLAVSLGSGSSFAAVASPIENDTGVTGRGGLAAADLDGDGLLDFVTTYVADGSADPSYANTWGLVAVENDRTGSDTRRYMSLGSTAVDDPGSIESVAIVETGRSAHRVAIGASDGALHVVDVTASSHSVFTTALDAAETCGGHVGFADVDADGIADVVSSTATPDGRSIVHVVVADSSGTALQRVDELQGWSASLEDRGNRVVVADFNGDELDDLVLSHGLAGLVSLLPNEGLAAVEVAAGSAPNPPDLSVAGASRVGSNLVVRCDATPTTGFTYLFIGQDVATSPGSFMYFDWFDTSSVATIVLGPSTGSFEFVQPIPSVVPVGSVWSLQAGFTTGAASDAVDVTILAEQLGQAVNPID